MSDAAGTSKRSPEHTVSENTNRKPTTRAASTTCNQEKHMTSQENVSDASPSGHTVLQGALSGPPPALLWETLNAATAHLQGIEAEITVLPVEGLELTANGIVMGIKYDKYISGGIDQLFWCILCFLTISLSFFKLICSLLFLISSCFSELVCSLFIIISGSFNQLFWGFLCFLTISLSVI